MGPSDAQCLPSINFDATPMPNTTIPTDSTAAERTALLARLRQLERAARALDPGTSRRRRLRDAAVASSERFLRRIDTLKAYDDEGVTGRGLLDAPILEHGRPLGEVIALLEQDVVRPGGNPASPGYLAYIPGGGLYHSALGDFLAAASNKYAGIFFAGPGPVRMEHLLVRWVADLVGYPATAAGNIASGGSIATLAAIVAAREAHGLKAADYASAVVYLTTQAHHCIEKALRIAGLGEAPVRHVPMDDGFRMRPDALAERIAADRAAGLRPWLVIAAAGTTDTGAVDPLDAIATIAERERCWFHVDAAYGGFFLLTEHGRRLLRGIERSDSVILDPHKGLFLPYGAGIVVVRDAQALAAAHDYEGAYMQDAEREPGEISPADLSAELSKHFRALRMWLPLMLVGTAAVPCGARGEAAAGPVLPRGGAGARLRGGPAAGAVDRDLSLGAAGRRAGGGGPDQPGDRRRRPAGWPGVPLVDPARRPIHAPDGGAGVPDAPADDRSGAPGAAGAGGGARRVTGGSSS